MGKKSVNFVILFGSLAQGKDTPLSDVDICVSLKSTQKERFKSRHQLTSHLPDKYDIHIFEDLSVYIQKEVLKGKILYVENKSVLLEKAFDVIREFDGFSRYYEYYVARDREVVAL